MQLLGWQEMWARFLGEVLVSLLIASVGGLLAGKLARRLGALARPVSEEGGREAIPLLGGLAIVAAAGIAQALCGGATVLTLAAAGALLAVGFVDDLVALSPGKKLGLQFLVVGGFVLAHGAFKLTGVGWLDPALVVLWLVACVNAFNLIDGLDGLAAGIGVVVSGTTAAVGYLHGDAALVGAGLATAGALVGFLFYNWRPATLLMGDCGALPMGFLLGLEALGAGEATANSALSRLAVPALVMFVPLLDVAVVSLSRLAGDRALSRRGDDHCHYRLLAMGLSVARVDLVCWSAAAVASLCAVALSALSHERVLATLPFLFTAAGTVALFMVDLTFDGREPSRMYATAGRLARVILSLGYKRRLADVALDLGLIAAAYLGAFQVRLDFEVGPALTAALTTGLVSVWLAAYTGLVIAGVYRAVWRYAGPSDAVRLLNGCVLAGVLVWVVAHFAPLPLSGSVLFLFVLLLFNLLLITRRSFRVLRKGVMALAAKPESALVVGVGKLGEAAVRHLQSLHEERVSVVGLLDDDPFMRGKLVHGVEVLGTAAEIEQIFSAVPFQQVVLAVNGAESRDASAVARFAQARGLKLRRFVVEVDDLGASPERTAQPLVTHA